MSMEVQGTLRFVANGEPAAMLERVQAMVAELAALGVAPAVTVTVELGRVKPAWMSKAGNLTTMFGCSWPELRTLRLSE